MYKKVWLPLGGFKVRFLSTLRIVMHIIWCTLKTWLAFSLWLHVCTCRLTKEVNNHFLINEHGDLSIFFFHMYSVRNYEVFSINQEIKIKDTLYMYSVPYSVPLSWEWWDLHVFFLFYLKLDYIPMINQGQFQKIFTSAFYFYGRYM